VQRFRGLRRLAVGIITRVGRRLVVIIAIALGVACVVSAPLVRMLVLLLLIIILNCAVSTVRVLINIISVVSTMVLVVW
jgi:hypothetical protein